jgi:DNA-binding MarR family transcriptional regulator
MGVDVESLDLGSLCYFVGIGFNDRVVTRLRQEGFGEVKSSFGFVVQHLLEGARTITDLAECTGISQQAASKRVREMIDAGVITTARGADRRERRVMLSHRGHALVQRTRQLRVEVVAEMLALTPATRARTARAVLLSAISQLGLSDSIQNRRIREPG